MPDYPRHLRHFDYTGFHRYSLTFCTFERQEHFRSASHVDLVTTQILRAAQAHVFDLLAYCFMPDHLHLLAGGAREDSDLKEFVALSKQYSGYHFKQATRKSLWQRYGYERTLRNEEATLDAMLYIIANPVRAGLVSHPEEYPFWGSTVCSREELLEHLAAAG
jgi:putative transposase